MPRWMCEKRTLKNYSNGIGAATLGYVALASVGGSIMLLLAAMIFPDIYVRGQKFYAPEYVTQITYIAAYILSLAVPFLVYMLVIRIPARVALPFRRADPVMTFGGLAVGMGLAAVANWSVELLQRSLGTIGVFITLPEIPTPKEPLAYALYAALITVLPAIFEEAVFRGVLMQSLRRFGDGFALIMSAALFGLYHLNFIQMPFAFLLGIGLGYFTLRTGSLWCAVLIHLFNNSQSLLIEWVFNNLGEKTAIMATDSLYIFWLVAGGFALCLMLSRDKNLFMLNPPPCDLPVREKVSAFWCTPLMIVAMAAAAVFTFVYVSFGTSTLYGVPLW